MRDIADLADYERAIAGKSPNFIITDVRYDNEAKAIIERGGEVIQITRRSAAPVATHSSEVGISPELVSYSVTNDGTVDAFEDAILRLVESEQLL